MTSHASVALAVPSAMAIAGYALATARQGLPALRVALFAGWLAHAAAMAVDLFGIGSGVPGARFGFAPALSVTMWLVIAVYGVESRLYPLVGARRVLALLGLLTVGLAWAFPGEAHVHAESPWAPVHWILGLASYGLFGAAALHAHLWRRGDRRMRLPQGRTAAASTTGQTAAATGAAGWSLGLPLLKLETLTFGFVLAGFVVLTATLVLGWWFADPWRWSHKTVFSLLAWVVFATLLLGRRAFGWRGRVATRWLYAGSGLLLLAYVGSRFVLEIVLHRSAGSY